LVTLTHPCRALRARRHDLEGVLGPSPWQPRPPRRMGNSRSSQHLLWPWL